MKKISKRKAVVFVFVAIILFSLIKSVGLMASYASLNKELELKNNQLTELKEETKRLEELLLPESESILMEEYAHKMGYVYPDERLYIFE